MKIKLTMLILVTLLALSGGQVASQELTEKNWEITTGADILVFVGGGSFYSNSADLFNETYQANGNNVSVVSEYDFATADLGDWDAILLTNFEDPFNAANLTAFSQYLELGNKFLWVAGNSDFSEFYQANATANPVLEAVKSNLRIDGGSISDSQSNDRASYRVVANRTGVSSPAVDAVTAQFNDTIFHGPAAVSFYDYDASAFGDLRTQDIASYNIDIYINSSANAEATDAGSLDDYDVYPYETGLTGNYPMVASQEVNNSVVVVSGEASFTDYKEMYDWVYENSRLYHDGILYVDSMLSYWLTDFGMNFASLTTNDRDVRVVTDTVTNTETETVVFNNTLTATFTESPISTLGATAAVFGVPALMVILRRKD